MKQKGTPSRYFRGRKYTYNRAEGRYQATTKPKTWLARDMWEAERGPLQKGEVVHHKNENPSFDNLVNLEKLNKGDHIRHHTRLRDMENLPRGVKVRRKREKWFVFINWRGQRKAVCVGLDKGKALRVAWRVWYRLHYSDSRETIRNLSATTTLTDQADAATSPGQNLQ